jgi:aryl-alcohol dehydrogenase-like predicted oxidoreductase
MRTRNIGALEVSVVGLGCNNFGSRIQGDQVALVVNACLDEGINFFDTADIYGGTRSEELLGAALGHRRSEVVVATKFGMAIDDSHKGARPDYVRQALEDSLRRLGTDYVDLYQLHAPDPETPIAETLEVLDEQVRAGKVREIGCSNFSTDQLRQAEAAVAPGAAHFVSVQNQYNLLHRDVERDVLVECERSGLAFIPYFPLSSGVLTGKYRRGEPRPQGSRLEKAGDDANSPLSETNLSVVAALADYAEGHGRSVGELAIAWLLGRPTVASVIAGATKPEQVKQNAAAADWVLTDAELEEVSALSPARS